MQAEFSDFISCRIENYSLYSCSQGLADNTVVAKVNGQVWDLDRPFEGDAELKLLKFEDPEGTFFIHSRYVHTFAVQ